jgi:hypothetical protein
MLRQQAAASSKLLLVESFPGSLFYESKNETPSLLTFSKDLRRSGLGMRIMRWPGWRHIGESFDWRSWLVGWLVLLAIPDPDSSSLVHQSRKKFATIQKVEFEYHYNILVESLSKELFRTLKEAERTASLPVPRSGQ